MLGQLLDLDVVLDSLLSDYLYVIMKKVTALTGQLSKPMHGNQEEVGNQEIRFQNVAHYPGFKNVNSELLTGNFRPIFEKYFSVVL